MSRFQAAPLGFLAANETLNSKIPLSSVAELTTAAVTGAGSASTAQNSINAQDLQNAFNALAFITAAAKAEDLSGDSLSTSLTRYTDLTPAVREQIVSSFTAASETKTAPELTRAQIFSLGTLVKLDWRVGVGVASSHSKSLQNAFVSLKFTVANGDNSQINNYTVDLSLNEFNGFAQAFRNIQTTLESV
jgi:hypothetical protein